MKPIYKPVYSPYLFLLCLTHLTPASPGLAGARTATASLVAPPAETSTVRSSAQGDSIGSVGSMGGEGKPTRAWLLKTCDVVNSSFTKCKIFVSVDSSCSGRNQVMTGGKQVIQHLFIMYGTEQYFSICQEKVENSGAPPLPLAQKHPGSAWPLMF